MAESARGEAEKLIVYLLDDFYLELEPVGRLDIVAALAKRAVDYYAALPAGAADPRNRPQPRAGAGALRCGAAQRNRCSTKASKALVGGGRRPRPSCVRRAIDRRRRRSGSASGSRPKRGWQAARTASPTNRQFAQPGRGRAEAADGWSLEPSIPLRRAYGLAMTFLGFSQAAIPNEEEAAVATLEEAREAYRSIDDLKLNDLPSAIAYAEASAWQMSCAAGFRPLRRAGKSAQRPQGDGAGAGKASRQHVSAARRGTLIGESLSCIEWTRSARSQGHGTERAKRARLGSDCRARSRATRSPGTTW